MCPNRRGMLAAVLVFLVVAGCQDVFGIDVVVSGPDTTACESNAGVCGAGQCRDQGKGYVCDCQSGYEFDGTTCTDIDECAGNEHDCDINATCRNIEGAFECACTGGYVGDGSTCTLPASCRDVLLAGYDDGVYAIDPRDGGSAQPYDVFCSSSLAGGGWQLISARTSDNGALFAAGVCVDPASDCSGTIPAAQRAPGAAPDILFATTDGLFWLHMTGLSSAGTGALFDVITLKRVLTDNSDCTYPHYCGVTLDTDLQVAAASPGYTPRFNNLVAQYCRLGGLWFGNGGGQPYHHVVSLNYTGYCPPGGMDFSGPENASLGNVACGQPGAMYFRYRVNSARPVYVRPDETGDIQQP
ncbi:MAG: hypothetical protein MJE77_43615 [Proteobacteria bacterium]|nr:hypothetical protein [Pseudomonadota bacterium]